MKHKLFCASCMMAVAVVGAAPAYADTSHGVECGGSGATSSPGNAATSPGSIFNEPTVNSVNGGKANQAYNTNARQGAGAPSQYDVACGKVTANGTGTPIQPTPTADTTNNSKATRDALGVISHTGKGANK
ncbi:MAG: hypothetical protein QOF25_1657 [Mycobacterium sp.]|jgi:hypothetical protein|nr:hypothetical protein [Mycobacterium sp.]